MPEEQKKPIRVEIPEATWLAKNLEFLEANYPGKWVAIKGDELVAVGDSLNDVMRAAEQQGKGDPLVLAIRRKDYQNTVLIRACH
jgi:hypothetical protein